MKFVPAGVVLAAAVFLGHSQERVQDFSLFYILFGCGTVIALLVLAAYDYRSKLRIQGNR
jgi:hypothetical protein